MPGPFRRSPRDYELLPQGSFDDGDFHELEPTPSHSQSSWYSRISHALPRTVKRISSPSTYTRRRKNAALRLCLCWTFFWFPCLCLTLVLLAGIFFPSYTNPPPHYKELRRAAVSSWQPGRANPRNEKIFIAASLYESHGEYTSGPWGEQVLELVDLLGPGNVYLSIYEDNPSPATKKSLLDFKAKVTCNASIVAEDLDIKTLPRVRLPNGETRLKRIAFLAEVRNRALAPIDSVGIAFDRVLYINDVNFSPIEAAQLLLSTNVDSTGRASYGAACAVDFINPFKFYDRFATRDLDGYSMGIPFYPWFTSAGSAASRKDVLSGTDAVRVRSCWGGMTAFEAKWFQKQTSPSGKPSSSTLTPLRFRYDNATFWESSECCLIHADLTYLRTGQGMPPDDSGIYMNPFIRVAYEPATLSWLALTRRPERLYSLIHDMLNRWVGLPSHNERMLEEPGQTYTDTMWEYDDPARAFRPNATGDDFKGHWAKKQHVALPGGFCGSRMLLVINETPEQGEGKWGRIETPRPPKDT
ncbi:uncharacterized protein EI97DRAFT_415842 [Westerdykella ornata]|uniref:Glycosyltransferase family 69 protein n=1 Tax=Westerdykella ornata TaxID=318751 RepID=A0A6A6JPC8_WESOR|nr:uncharacterized protein EI97DRAFT_415842 [Westerdykella ornata]KAF2277993.1 hypothetical protein EI97DRAFT_415842 [Westerdykella ornata]